MTMWMRMVMMMIVAMMMMVVRMMMIVRVAVCADPAHMQMMTGLYGADLRLIADHLGAILA